METKIIDSEKISNVKKTEQIVKVFWTGGFDSTFRIVQLSRLNITVQPIYILCGRKSEANELNAIEKISDFIVNHQKTRCIFLPLVKVNVEAIKLNESISHSYERLRQKTAIGPQYDWLARFAKNNYGLELSVEKSDLGKTVNCIKNYGEINLISNGEVQYYELDKDKSDPDLINVMGSFHFPYPMFDITKQDMLKEYKTMGLEEVMLMTWFCHTPINNKPCGICHPCKTVIADGLSYRIPQAGQKRYNTEKKYGNYLWFRIYKKIRWRIKGY
ncbi:hypothetical protein [Saccharicrinis sp. FJH54]|uniref:hypothetical protein n=1 Tax=Saccharicrinis sp. FJH54 TaxID=3344665 RepID=UPI0035D4DC2B